MIIHRPWCSRHSVRGAVSVDRRGARLAQAVLSEHVVFEEVDDRLAREIAAHSWPHTRRVLLHATCLDLAPVLSRFSSVESLDLEGAAATLAGQLAPLEHVPEVGVSLVGPRLWSPSLGVSLEALEPVELAVDTTTGGGAQWRTPGFDSGIDDAEETRRLLNPQRASLRRLWMKSIDSFVEGDWPTLETLSLDMPHARLGVMPALSRLAMTGRLVSVAGSLPNLRALEVRGELSVEAVVALAPQLLSELFWTGDGAVGLDVLLSRSGPSLRKLALAGPDSVIDALVRANAPMVALESLAIENPLTDVSVSWLLENELVGHPQRLWLHAQTPDATLARLIERFGPQLRSLHGPSLGPLSLDALIRRPPPRLESVAFAGLPAASLRAIAASPLAQTLELLRWTGGVDDQGVAQLASTASFPRLRSVSLESEDSLSQAVVEAIEARFGPA